MLLITFYTSTGKRVQFICADFQYAMMIMGRKSYGYTVLG